MKIINFGSLNIDKVYSVDTFVRPGQTIFARDYNVFAGGKGLNQSVAAARAGGRVLHAGAIGEDGEFLKELLKQAGADVSCLLTLKEASGHAVIEVNRSGQNRIIVYGGTNHSLSGAYIDAVLNKADKGDLVLLQNETNCIAEIIKKAHARGLSVAFNPSPVPEEFASLPSGLVDYFLVNEIEAAALAGVSEQMSFEETLRSLCRRFPSASVVMTLGEKGVLYGRGGERIRQDAFAVKAKDSTGAGDTFTGYFLSALLSGRGIKRALKEACAGAALAVTREGAAPSIPVYEEVAAFLKANDGGD